MKILFKFENVSTAGDLKQKLERYFLRMNRKLGSLREEFKTVWVKIRKERGIYQVEGEMRLPGKQVVVKERGDKLLVVVGKVRNSLVRRVKEYKEKLRH